MFDQLFSRPGAVAIHTNGPWAAERIRYLTHCQERGDALATRRLKACNLLWIARGVGVTGDLHLSSEQVQALVDRGYHRHHRHRRDIRNRHARRRLARHARAWLRYLGVFKRPAEAIQFQSFLESYCRWAKDERALSEATIECFRRRTKQFLQWYGRLGNPLEEIQPTHIDAYLVWGHQQGWRRITVGNVVDALRAFLRYGVQQGWCRTSLPQTIRGPRVYALENLPAGPAWSQIQSLLAGLDSNRPADVRDRAILMLFAIYGLRRSEVARLCLDDIDWEHDAIRIRRAKRREAQRYPLLASVGNASAQYLRAVRHPSSHREVFLTLVSPYGPLSGGALHYLVCSRLKLLNVQTTHFGPHSLRHACATRLIAEGLSLKEIGDHLGHVSASSTRVYAKVNLPGLREVAAFDLGELP